MDTPRSRRRFDDASFRYFSPGSPEEVIESHLRHLNRIKNVLAGETRERKGDLGLTLTELSDIYREATAQFIDSAKLSEELREQRVRFRENFDEKVARIRKNFEIETDYLAQTQAVLFARQCDKAIGRATGDFADMLTQAVIARHGRKEFSLKLRKEMWAECLRFATWLADFSISGRWIEEAWGLDPREAALPHLYSMETISDQQAAVDKFVAKFKPRFEEGLRMGSSGWLNEAENRIELRRLLSIAPSRRPSRKNPAKLALARLLVENPKLTTEQICARLDAKNETNPQNAPVPNSWRKSGARSWIDAHGNLSGRVRTFISTVRKEIGISYTSAREY